MFFFLFCFVLFLSQLSALTIVCDLCILELFIILWSRFVEGDTIDHFVTSASAATNNWQEWHWTPSNILLEKMIPTCRNLILSVS